MYQILKALFYLFVVIAFGFILLYFLRNSGIYDIGWPSLNTYVQIFIGIPMLIYLIMRFGFKNS